MVRQAIGIRLGLIVVLVGIFACAIAALAAGQEDCRRECQDRFAEDTATCAADYQQAREAIDAEYRACVDAAKGFFDRMQCEIDRESALSQAELDRSRCEHAAENDLAQCLLDCETSPSAP